MLCVGDIKRQEQNERQTETFRSSSKQDGVDGNYVYKPLLDTNSIRVLELQLAATSEVPLHAMLVTETNRERADVCIFQQDLKEKAIQVARMDDIYIIAQLVLAWLGPASETSAEASEFMEVLAELSKAPEYDKHVRQHPAIVELTSFPMGADDSSQIQETRRSTHVDEILERLWSTRLWVV
ncbi:hypothetical protein K505DRAFT_331627 [Melanomma pulvis-pyrius CBS 109.77]|uniref:Heterokaryon incompatibility domain-containing protein n=1 Tax=Melanomma pulvis-pyrius CBS 109.77 TaxID=1314802 RepID=A0A6A6XWZ6_9PLEO|nr:hypothetical protein K505DRAFT_331627 [Melanomma pulvis-pyrius CBS 109.77]